MITIIIPAHNEASVIGRCISTMLDGAAPGELQVVVACNGCSDQTADIARNFGAPVEVIETPVASKSHALNLAEQAAHGFPRFYVDADVVLTHDAIIQVTQVLQQGDILAAAPGVRFDLTDRPWTVRAFYSVWSRLPYLRSGIGGSGAFALSEMGRSRFESFPHLTADDAFARLHFSPQERKSVESCYSIVSTPRSLSSLLDIKTRSQFGNYELRQRFPHLQKNEKIDHGKTLMWLSLNPRLWPALAIYFYVKLVAGARMRWKYAFGNHQIWERDESSRQVAIEPDVATEQ
jgi:glycosyltransferase involved in cell wall biosynthesis